MTNNQLEDQFRSYTLCYLNNIAARMYDLGLDEIDTGKIYIHLNFRLHVISFLVRGEIKCFKYEKNSVLKELDGKTPLNILLEAVNSCPEIDRKLCDEEEQINRLMQEFVDEHENAINSNNAGDRG